MKRQRKELPQRHVNQVMDRKGNLWTEQFEGYYANSTGRVIRHVNDILRLYRNA